MGSSCFFGYDSKLLGLGINEQMTSFRTCVNLLKLLQLLLGLSQLLQKLFAASAGVVSASTEAVAASAGAIIVCAKVVATSAGGVFGVFNQVSSLEKIICLVHI